jgi:hypothetical protein
VGGDYFDYVQTGDGQLSFAVGDVSGKGIPAAILMANVQALFRAEARSGTEPDQVLDRMNRRLCEIERPDRFVSFFCAILDPATQELRYSAAGHPPPLLVRHDGTVHHLDAGGLLLGIQPDVVYPTGIVRLRPGDLVLCYTDGIPDPYSDGSPFREDQLEEMVRSLRHLTATGLLERLLSRIQEVPILEDGAFPPSPFSPKARRPMRDVEGEARNAPPPGDLRADPRTDGLGPSMDGPHEGASRGSRSDGDDPVLRHLLVAEEVAS